MLKKVTTLFVEIFDNFRDVDDDTLAAFQFGGVMPSHMTRIGASTTSAVQTTGSPQVTVSSHDPQASSTTVTVSSVSQTSTGAGTDKQRSCKHTVSPDSSSSSSSSDDDDDDQLVASIQQAQSSQHLLNVAADNTTPISGAQNVPAVNVTQIGAVASVQPSSAAATGWIQDKPPVICQSASTQTTPSVTPSVTATSQQGNNGGKGAKPKVYSTSASYVPPDYPSHDYKTHSDR